MFTSALLFGASLLGIQGTIYFLQFFAASQLPAAEYSQVRVTESLIAVLSLLSTLGIPSAFIPAIAVARGPGSRSAIVRSGLTAVTIFSLIVGVLFAVTVQIRLFPRSVGFGVTYVVMLTALVSYRLSLVNAMQAAQRFSRLAAVALPSCGLAIVGYSAAYYVGAQPTSAWLLARITLEALLLAGLLSIAREAPAAEPDLFPGREPRRILPLVAAAAPVGVSLILRSIIEHGPVLCLAAVEGSSVAVAEVGVVLTLTTVALIPAAVVQGAVLPRLAILLAARAAGSGARRVVALFVGLVVASTLFFVVATFAARSFVAWAAFIDHGIAFTAIMILVAKATSNGCGAYLLAAGRGRAIASVNGLVLLLGLVAAGAVARWSSRPISTGIALAAIAAVEACAAGMYLRYISGLNASDAARP